MKKLITRLLIILVTINLVACGNNDNQANKDVSNQEIDNDSSEIIDEANNATTTSNIDPDFKIAMDNYESFFDEYIEFMQTYQDSEDTTSMLFDYLAYLEKFASTMEKLDEIEDTEMNDAEAIYYLEVTTRIMEKLAKIQ